jgi:hypothetical protein
VELWSFEGARNDANLDTSAVIAAGKHLFPFRTEKLSPLAPMVLGGQPPGRVGSRRLIRAARKGGSFFSPSDAVFTVLATMRKDPELDGYIAGFVDGEGSFSVSVQRNPSCRVGLQLVPEFHVSQNGDRAQVLNLILERLGCGYIKPNSNRDQALVYVVRERQALLESVIPFFERVPLRSAKRGDFEHFAWIVRQMSEGRHRTVEGFAELLAVATSMNGGGRFRKVAWAEVEL